jgi:hypothetical protein
MAGRFDHAVALARLTWTSLPGAAENRASWTLAKARELYLAAGGSLEAKATAEETPEEAPEPHTDANPFDAPIPRTAPPVKEASAMPLALLIQIFGPAIAQLIPQVAKLFDQSPVAQRNTAAAEAVINTITSVAQSPDLPTALSAMKADPSLAQTVTQAVVTHPEVIGLIEVGGGVEKAREFSRQVAQAEKPFWYNPLFWITVMFMPMIYLFVLSAVLNGAPDGREEWWMLAPLDSATRNGLMNLLVGLIVGGVCGIWFGTSWGSQKKDERTRASDVQPNATRQGE